MSSAISWQVELEIKPGKLEGFRALNQAMVSTTRAEAGVLIYERFLGHDKRTVQIYERYVDCEAAVSHLLAFAQLYGPQFASMVERKRFAVFGEPSVELKALLDGLGATYFAPFAGFDTD